MSIAQRLAGFDFFRDLSARERDQVASQMSQHVHPAGTHLFHLGEIGDAAYFVLDGEVSLHCDGVCVARRGAGELVGEFALIDQSARSASARIEMAAEVVRWPRTAFSRAIVEYPGVGTALFRLLTAKLREDIGTQVAFGLEQQRWRVEMSWAREVQSGLLPAREAHLPGAELACLCEPAGEVGGDLYDYRCVSIPSGPMAPSRDPGKAGGERHLAERPGIGLLVADVTGHGVYSALLAAMAKSCFHNQADLDPRPVSVMRALAKTVELSAGKRLLASAAYVLIGDGGFVYANAGHPDIVHLEVGHQRLTRLGALDPILGALPPAAFPGHEVGRPAAPGDLLVLYSDGLTEAINRDGELFGAARLDAVLLERPYASASECREAILGALHAFRGDTPSEDDLTLAVLRIV